MALVGVMIGGSFAVSLVAAPLLYRAVGLSGLFVFTGLLALAGIGIVLRLVPTPPQPPSRAAARRPGAVRWTDGDLLRLDAGIFVLHFAQTAMFVVVPARLVASGLPLAEHWKLYLPVVVASFAVMMPPLNWAERMGRLRGLFLFAIALQALAQVGFALIPPGIASLSVLLLLFFIAFNMLEALIPSLVSRLAPAAGRGTAMGVYNTSQSLGIFAGGALGGVLAARTGDSGVFVAGALLMAAWFVLAWSARRWPLRGGRLGDVRAGAGSPAGEGRPTDRPA